MKKKIAGINVRIGVGIGIIVVLLLLLLGLSIKLFGKEVYYHIDKEYPLNQVNQINQVNQVNQINTGEHWRAYLSEPYSSTMLLDGKGTVELLLDKTLESYPVDMAAEDIFASVKEESYVVFEDSRLVTGGAYWNSFYEKVQNREKAQVKLVKYYTLGDESRYAPEYYEQIKDDYPMLIFVSLVYVPKEGFYVNDRLSTQEEPEIETQCFPYLKHFEGEAPTSFAAYSRYDRYVLVDDYTATWEQIEHQMFSSYYDPNENYIAWSQVYCNLTD